MNDETILAQARKAGIAIDWTDATGRPQRVSVASLARILEALGDGEPPQASPPLFTATVGQPIEIAAEGPAELVLEDGSRQSLRLHSTVPPIDATGYHTLRYAEREITLAVAPPRCITVDDIAPGQKLWGLAVQLYGLKRADDGGVGDTTALAMLAREAATQGADALALSPTHALFPDDATRFSPYSPSSRLFLNPLLIDPVTVLGEHRVEIETEPDQPLIDWPSAARRKYALLRRLYDDFSNSDSSRAPAFESFIREGGPELEGHAVFEARNGGDPRYYAFLQWLADGAFAAAQKAAKDAGMRIGLISDLAIGLDGSGAQVGAAPRQFLTGLGIGAPPDIFNPQGQDWGITSFSPQALVAGGFAPFIATLRANMRHAGGVRIDHAMGLMRLWLVPHGAPPSEGAYVSYPLDDLLRLLALESHRHRAIVIGEDLGTVPQSFQARCREAGIAGMDVLWFQRDRERFLAPHEWRSDAVAMTTTHDLPTAAGWWRGADLELRRGIGTVEESEITQRPAERAALWQAFTDAGVAGGAAPGPDATDAVVDAAVAFVGQARGSLAIVPLEDIMGVAEQPNLPGTIDQHPNWRRRFRDPADEMLRQPGAEKRLRLLKERRSS
ncbi:MAG: 4-alpha-glucanotransferase [Enhydrobacter sp.]|nr:4-alpha-glucanotransferase [Enhydrobacter sp.]